MSEKGEVTKARIARTLAILLTVVALFFFGIIIRRYLWPT